MTHRHNLVPLASEAGYLVQYCSECEIIHVDVGPVTLRLRPGALDVLARVLSRASMALHHAEADERTIRLVPPVVN